MVSHRLGDFLGNEAVPLAQPAEIPLMFYGISQGAILGAGYTEFSSLVRKAFTAFNAKHSSALELPTLSLSYDVQEHLQSLKMLQGVLLPLHGQDSNFLLGRSGEAIPT